jgi:hypothetical protein
MRKASVALVLGSLMLVSPAWSQNVVTQAPTIDTWSLEFHIGDPAEGIALPSPGEGILVYAYVDDLPKVTVPSATCVQDGLVPLCSAPIAGALKASLQTPGIHTLKVSVASPHLALIETAPSEVLQVTAGSCSYTPVGSTVAETRPSGSVLQGFNAIGPAGATGNQAFRIGQLRSWGWLVEWQFVDGSVRADKLDRLFLIATCP